MVVKSKISKAKRNNQKTTKLVKRGVIKKTSKKGKTQTKRPSLPKVQNNVPPDNLSEEESDHGQDMLEMVEKDDLDFIKNAISNRSYTILNRVHYSSSSGAPALKGKKRKREDDDTLENEYEEQIEDRSSTRIRPLLPIKTGSSLVRQEMTEEVSDVEDQTGEDDSEAASAEEEEEGEEKEEFTFHDDKLDLSQPISVAQLLAARNETLTKRKIHIGTLSSGLLESPIEKVTNLRTLINLMNDETPEVYFTVRKLVIVSLLEVFKDILPDYELKNVNPEGVKLKKETLNLQRHEDSLVLYYKKFLRKLQKYAFMLMKNKGQSRKLSIEEVKVSELAVQTMCELLIARPYFNYSTDLAQILVLFLNNHRPNIRDFVKKSICTVFKEDKKEELTLKILRLVNNYLKNHSQSVNVEMLDILLVLNLKDANLDQDKEQEIKNKKMQAKKARILQMSKKERKRKKKLQELEKEMLETKAEENRQSKQRNINEIVKIIFNIYFRILKNSENTKMLSACLEGLAKFAHCINLEYYVDIVNVLNRLLNEDWLGYKEQLHCIQTIFIMLSGQGEAINVDPTRFYTSLYKDLLTINAGKNHELALLLLKTLIDALIKRRKKLTNKRLINFTKRLATFSLQLLHNGSLGCLGLIKTLMQLNHSIDILLDLDSTSGEGHFQPEIEDPEFANASNSALFETVLLARHYHPVVRHFARNIASGVPATGDGSLPLEYGKLTVEELYSQFSMAEMAFNPPVPIAKKTPPKAKPIQRFFASESFHEECKAIVRKNRPKGRFWISI